MGQVPRLPGTPIEDLTPPDVCAGPPTETQPAPPPTTTTPTTPTTPSHGGKDPGPTANDGDNGDSNGGHPSSRPGHRQSHSGSRRPADRNDSSTNSHGQDEGSGTKKHHHKSPRRSD